MLPFYDHIYKNTYNRQAHNTQKQNKNTEEPPNIQTNQTIFKRNPLRNKMNPHYIKTKVTAVDKNKITGISKKKPITTHLRKIKRLRKNPVSFQPPDPDSTGSCEPLPGPSGLQTS